MTKERVLVYGSLNQDYVYQVKHFPGPGETAIAEDFQVSCGGKGLNQAVAFDDPYQPLCRHRKTVFGNLF